MIVMVYYQFFIGCQPYVEFACVALDGVGFYQGTDGVLGRAFDVPISPVSHYFGLGIYGKSCEDSHQTDEYKFSFHDILNFEVIFRVR